MFGLLIDLRSMADNAMHGSGAKLVNVQDGIQLEIERDLKWSGDMNCHVFMLSDAQMGLENRQLKHVMY